MHTTSRVNLSLTSLIGNASCTDWALWAMLSASQAPAPAAVTSTEWTGPGLSLPPHPPHPPSTMAGGGGGGYDRRRECVRMHSPAGSSRPRRTDPPGQGQVHPVQLLRLQTRDGRRSPHCCRHNSQQWTSGSPRWHSCRRGRFHQYPRAECRGRRHWARPNSHVARLRCFGRRHP